jgi:hypothetical protein
VLAGGDRAVSAKRGIVAVTDHGTQDSHEAAAHGYRLGGCEVQRPLTQT